MPIESFGSGHLVQNNVGQTVGGVAVDASDGNVYATDRSQNDVSVFDAIVLPTVIPPLPSEQSPRSVTLNGTVDPEGSSVTSCVFEYDTRGYKEGEGAHGTSVPCETAGGISIGGGTGPVVVSARLSGLTPETRYDYRLVAENSAHIPSVTANQVFTAGPVLGGESVSDVASSSATLEDSIDPNGADTHYYIQYGPTSAYGSFAPVSAPGVDLGESVGAQSISIHLQGLQAGTTYHYSFVAMQDGEAFAEPDRVFATQSGGASGGSGTLADGRAWELVSPPNAGGALLELTEDGGQVQAASDGSAITYIGEGCHRSIIPGRKPDLSRRSFRGVARRGAGVAGDLTLPSRLPEDGVPAEELFAVLLQLPPVLTGSLARYGRTSRQLGTPPLAPGVSERTLYLRDDTTGAFLPLVTPANVPEGTKIDSESLESPTGANPDPKWQLHFLAATPDLSHVIFKTPAALTPEAIDEETVRKAATNRRNWVQSNLYEWDTAGLAARECPTAAGQ